MATKIDDTCIRCGACETECPNDAIRLGDDIFVIDPDLCTECVGFHETQKCQEACPVDCCIPDLERGESENILFERAVKIHADRGVTLSLNASTSHFRTVR
jgi:ferredoxin